MIEALFRIEIGIDKQNAHVIFLAGPRPDGFTLDNQETFEKKGYL
jgi:hypothetical protein